MQEQEWPEEAIDVWRGVAVGCRMCGCWLQGEVWRVLGLANGRSYWCGLMAARWVGLEGFKRLERLERLERFRAGKRQTWTPIRSHWCVALGCLLTARVATRSHWCVARCGCLEGFKRLERLEGFRAGKRQTWTPIRSHWCVALGCGGFESWQTADLGAHKKPLMCGLGVPVGCKSGHKKPLMCGAGWLLAAGWSLDGFRAGKRQKLLMWLDGCKMGWFGGF